MKCHEIMKTSVECCDPNDEIREVARRMAEKNIGFMPVRDEVGRVLGTVTDRDLVVRVLATDRDLETTRVHEVMSQPIIACRPTDDLHEAERLMSRHRVSRVICVDEHQRPVGVISLSDVADVERGARAATVLRNISHREAGIIQH
ncbi:MAG: CBS domain-containing protein [Myxococcota bacterium]